MKHQAGYGNRLEINFHSRRTIPASPSNDESVVDDVDVVVNVVIWFPELTDQGRDTFMGTRFTLNKQASLEESVGGIPRRVVFRRIAGQEEH